MNVVSVVVEPITTYQLKLYYQNYLESGTVTVTSENSSFPKYRLYDRAQGLLFKGASIPSIFDIDVDLGTSGPYPMIDNLILGKNHNLYGQTVVLYASEDGVDYAQIDTWVVLDGINRRSFTGLNRRYWRLRINDPIDAPEIGELFLTKVLAFERNPNWDYGYGRVKKVNRLESEAGYSQKTKSADMRKRRRYHLTKMDSGQRIEIETFEDVTESIKNFYIEDLQGNLFFAELPEPLPDFIAEKMGRWALDFVVQEVVD